MSRQQHCKSNRHRFICTKNLILVLDSYGKCPRFSRHPRSMPNLMKHCDSLAFFTTQHLRPSDHTRALFQHARPDAGAGCCRGGTRAAAVHSGPVSRCTRYSCTLCMDRDVRTARLVLLLRSGMSPCAGRRVLQPSITRTDGPTGRPGDADAGSAGGAGRQAGQASAAQLFQARAWTGPSGPRRTVRRPASGHMRPCERAAATPEAEGWRSAANGLTTAVRSRFARAVRCGALLAAAAIPANGGHQDSFAWLLFNCGAHVCWF